MYEQTPLSVVQRQLVTYTDRNPADAAAVLKTIRAAVGTLGGDALDFSGRLVRSLNPYESGGLGIKGVQMLEQVGAVPVTSEDHQVQWGGLSLLGVLAMTHDPALDRRLYPDPELWRAQTSSKVARDALHDLVSRGGPTGPYHKVARAFLSHEEPLSTQDVALEFMIGGLHEEANKDALVGALHAATEEFELTFMGVALGEEQDYILAPLSRDAQNRFNRMDWLNGLDLANVKGRKVYHDGGHVATIIDLTVAHKVLHGLKEALENSPMRDQFWNQLATSVASFAVKGRAKRRPTEFEKVPTYYGGNIHADENLMRFYYVPLGEGLSGAKIVGLVAAIRGKTKQMKVLNIIGHARQRITES